MSLMWKKINYWKRILGVYIFGRGRSPLSFWYEKLEISLAWEKDSLGQYYMSFRGKAAYAGPRDGEGVIMLSYGGGIGLKYNPIAIAQYGLGNLNLFLETKEQKYFSESKKQADWLVKNLKPNNFGVPVWGHEFDWVYREQLKRGWYSGLAQGSGISLLARMYNMTKDDKYLAAAKDAFRALELPVDRGGVIFADELGDVWIEEYITSRPTHILNGFIWAIWGVWDYWLLTGNETAIDLFRKCEKTLAWNLKRYDLGFWSAYDLSEQRMKMIASAYYHGLHIVQLKIMNVLTGKGVFEEYSKKWDKYKKNQMNRFRALVYKIVFKILYF